MKQITGDWDYINEEFLDEVLCKNCKHWRKLMLNSDGYGVCRSGKVANQCVTPPDWYCADGEKE